MVIFGIIMAVLGFGGILAVRIWRKNLQIRRAAAVPKPNLESLAQQMAEQRKNAWYPPEAGWPGVSPTYHPHSHPPTPSNRLTRPRRTETSSTSSDDSNSLMNGIIAGEIISSVESSSSHDSSSDSSSSWGDSSSSSSSDSSPSSDFTAGGDSGGGGASGDW